MRHQIDLMDLGRKGAIKFNGVSYRYVLSVMDVFSRFVWLRPLSVKSSKNIADELRILYLEHGPPRVIQCDQGGEFKGAVKELCRQLEIKIICSPPYHPQSQGKVERSHRALRSKMEYDFIQMGAKGVNWAESLPNYQRILNEDPKEVLAYKTPFEVYFARHCNSYNTAMTDEEVVENAGKCNPSEGDRRRRSKHASNIRRQAAKASERCSERMVRGHLRAHPPSKYNVGEKVYVRLPRKGGIKSAQKKRYVIEALIMKRNIRRHVYKEAYTSPVTGKKKEKWLPVDDITSLTLGEEKRKQRAATLSKKRQKAHRSSYYIPMEPDDYKKIIEDQGFDVEYNPPGDGSCQFAALAHQLSALGVFRSSETMRREIVGCLEKNAVDNEGFPLLEFLPEFTSLEEYLLYMAKSNTFGDQITLFAAANLYNINIQVISTLGPGAQHLFEPSSSVPLGTVYLGHFAAGKHYVSLLPWFSDSGSDRPECDSGSGEVTKGVGRSGEDPCTAGFDKISRRDTTWTQVVMARVERKQLLTANVTEIKTEVAGTQVLAEVAGIQVLAEVAGIQVLAEVAGTQVLAGEAGTQVLPEVVGTQVLAEVAGIQVLAEVAGTQVLAGEAETKVLPEVAEYKCWRERREHKCCQKWREQKCCRKSWQDRRRWR